METLVSFKMAATTKWPLQLMGSFRIAVGGFRMAQISENRLQME